ncbi:MAG TPA: hypothetical protein VIE46_01000 [Gemmatimonadales bacterium]
MSIRSAFSRSPCIAADAFLRKPFQLVDLARIVRRFVETAAA